MRGLVAFLSQGADLLLALADLGLQDGLAVPACRDLRGQLADTTAQVGDQRVHGAGLIPVERARQVGLRDRLGFAHDHGRAGDDAQLLVFTVGHDGPFRPAPRPAGVRR